jgi:2-hydroxy-6-oxonona-2,4-dienedioate hydrolase
MRVRGWLLAVLMVMAAGTCAQSQSLIPDVSRLPPMRTVDVFGQPIAYYEAGKGPTLVLVHGFGSSVVFDWGHVVPLLVQHYHVIALDQVGFGRSARPKIDYSIQTFVDFLGEFLRAKHVEHFTLDGESMGGWVVASYTIQSLGAANAGPMALPRPDRIILSDAAGNGTRAWKTGGRPHVAGTFEDAKGVADVFYDKARVTPEYVRWAWEQKMKDSVWFTEDSFYNNPEVEKESVHDRIGAITVPTLVIWGEEDELVSLASGKDYAARIPGAKLVVIPEAGHGPAIEKPEAYTAAVRGFVQ